VRGLLDIFKKANFKKAKTRKAALSDRTLFKKRYHFFQKVLAENNAVLGIMADMEERLSGYYTFDMDYVRSNCKIMGEKVQNIIENLNKLSHGKYPALYDAFKKINPEIEEALARKADIPVAVEAGEKKTPFKDTPVLKMLGAVLKSIVSLTMVSPDHVRFKPEFCQTYHDIIRFAHEKAMDEMFKISDSPDIGRGVAVKLKVRLPLDIYVIDLGGGVENGRKKLTPDNIRSIPMNALLRAMIATEWPGPPPLDVKGFLTVVTHTATDPESQRALQEPSYAFIAKEYMNFSINLGYHMQTIEAYAGDNINDNYIRFFIKGGGASLDRRARRTRLIKDILEKMDFTVERTEDVLDARLTRHERSTIEEKLRALARLTAHTKQLDMTLFNDAIVDWYVKEFFKKHYAAEEKSDMN
jgi:pyruvate,water dikinase